MNNVVNALLTDSPNLAHSVLQEIDHLRDDEVGVNEYSASNATITEAKVDESPEPFDNRSASFVRRLGGEEAAQRYINMQHSIVDSTQSFVNRVSDFFTADDDIPANRLTEALGSNPITEAIDAGTDYVYSALGTDREQFNNVVTRKLGTFAQTRQDIMDLEDAIAEERTEAFRPIMRRIVHHIEAKPRARAEVEGKIADNLIAKSIWNDELSQQELERQQQNEFIGRG